MWRQGTAIHIWQSNYVIIHLMIFASSQVLASSLLEESMWFRLANISANGILVLLGCISVLNRSPTKSSYGESIARFALVYVLIGFVLLPILFNSFEDMGFYYSVITVLFVVGLFALMGGLQSLLMSDVIDYHYQSSIEDPLTGIFNRRYFFQAISSLAQSAETEEMNAVILCDVDKFKQFNDKFGHDVGDEILKKFAHMLRDTVGGQGVVCRYGGEEFTILLQKYSLPDAVQFAEVIRRHCEGLTVNVDGKEVNITASFGVTQVWDLQDIDLALKLADEALLNAKATGRNRVISR
jgi:diguanylate cyclase (GGDEF)-like protein